MTGKCIAESNVSLVLKIKNQKEIYCKLVLRLKLSSTTPSSFKTSEYSIFMPIPHITGLHVPYE